GGRTRASMPSAGAGCRAARARDWLMRKFSATVRSGKMPASSGEYPMPLRARWWVGRREMSRPFRVTVPLRMGRRPMMLSMVVVFPAPLRPTRHTDSPSWTAREMSSSTWAGPRKVLTREGSSTASLPVGLLPEEVGRHLLVAPDLVGRAVGEDAALVHGDDARAVREHHVHVVLDDHRGDAARADHRGDDVHDGRLLAGAHPAGRLVEEE